MYLNINKIANTCSFHCLFNRLISHVIFFSFPQLFCINSAHQLFSVLQALCWTSMNIKYYVKAFSLVVSNSFYLSLVIAVYSQNVPTMHFFNWHTQSNCCTLSYTASECAWNGNSKMTHYGILFNMFVSSDYL